MQSHAVFRGAAAVNVRSLRISGGSARGSQASAAHHKRKASTNWSWQGRVKEKIYFLISTDRSIPHLLFIGEVKLNKLCDVK